MRAPLRRVPHQRVGTALLVAAFVLAAVAAAVRFFAAPEGRTAGASTVGVTLWAGLSGAVSRNAAHTGSGTSGGASGQPAPGSSGRTRASSGLTMPPPVSVAGAAALPSAHVHPGYDTPEDSADGFYQALLSGTPARACAYVATPCPSFGSRPVTGQVTVIEAVPDGSEALVEVTGTICVATSCEPLTDRLMMPAGPGSFSTSWTSLTGGVYGWAASPLPCVQNPATRQWRVKLALNVPPDGTSQPLR
jgi:hypothetical protein